MTTYNNNDTSNSEDTSGKSPKPVVACQTRADTDGKIHCACEKCNDARTS